MRLSHQLRRIRRRARGALGQAPSHMTWRQAVVRPVPTAGWQFAGWYYTGAGNGLGSAACPTLRVVGNGGWCGTQPYDQTPLIGSVMQGVPRYHAVWRNVGGSWEFDGWLWTDSAGLFRIEAQLPPATAIYIAPNPHLG